MPSPPAKASGWLPSRPRNDYALAERVKQTACRYYPCCRSPVPPVRFDSVNPILEGGQTGSSTSGCFEAVLAALYKSIPLPTGFSKGHDTAVIRSRPDRYDTYHRMHLIRRALTGEL